MNGIQGIGTCIRATQAISCACTLRLETLKPFGNGCLRNAASVSSRLVRQRYGSRIPVWMNRILRAYLRRSRRLLKKGRERYRDRSLRLLRLSFGFQSTPCRGGFPTRFYRSCWRGSDGFTEIDIIFHVIRTRPDPVRR